MQQNLIPKIREYLPEIDVNELIFDNDEHPYENDLDHSIESIKIWSHTILEKAKLPIAVSEAKALTTKYGLDTNEGCALQMVVELDAVNKSIENQYFAIYNGYFEVEGKVLPNQIYATFNNNNGEIPTPREDE